MLHLSHLFFKGDIWVLPLPDGTFQTRFRFASLEPPENNPGIYESPTPPVDGAILLNYRKLYAHVPEEEMLAIARSRGLLQWRLDNRHCGRCGTALDRSRIPDDYAMVCPACGTQIYPRISPAVIALITRGDEVLLEHNMQYGYPYGTLVAGYVEPGETAEQAVARETFEETGIRLKNIRYVASQPWPFPASLMLGFRAEYDSGELKPDGKEIDRCSFFRKSDLPAIPPPPSIARRLLDAWIRGEI